MRRSALVLAVALIASATSPVAAAPAASIDLLKASRVELPEIKRATRVPVLLPRSLLLAGSPAGRVYASGGVQRGGWVLTLAGAPGCASANACYLASFEARRGGGLPGRSNVRLAKGVRGFYLPIGCGASCSPASLWFVHGGVLNSWQVKHPPRKARAALVRMANEAIRAGPR